jgi:hypothetical protein
MVQGSTRIDGLHRPVIVAEQPLRDCTQEQPNSNPYFLKKLHLANG